MRNPHFFQKCFHFCWNQNKVSVNDNFFERNEDCATAFLKWTDFNRNTYHDIIWKHHEHNCSFLILNIWRFHFSTGKRIQPISFIIIIYTEIDLVTHGACWVETQLNVKKLPFLYRLTKATQTQISSRNTYLYCSRKRLKN